MTPLSPPFFAFPKQGPMAKQIVTTVSGQFVGHENIATLKEVPAKSQRYKSGNWGVYT
jgi:hypothetical protein